MTQTTEKKIITLLLESRKSFFLSVQYASSLEEAFVLAKMEFVNQNPKFKDGLEGAKIGLFHIKTMKELTESPTEVMFSANNPLHTVEEDDFGIPDLKDENFFDVLKTLRGEIKKETAKINPLTKEKETMKPQSEKNTLMHEIIKTKDKRILEMNKEKFTKDEIKYIQEKIK